MRRLVGGLVGLVVLLLANQAWAAYHLMKITEVFPGTSGVPNAQYIELQMYAAGQNLVGGHTVTVYNAAGTAITTVTFAGTVASGANQSTILIATAEAATLFGVTPDLTITPVIPLTGGKVCFETIDCVAWGNYSGGATGVGVPARQQLGFVHGRALARRLDISGGPTVLDAGDDTDQSASDFTTALPTPRNNDGDPFTLPPSTCGNNTIEGLESCDDNNLDSSDGCSSTCVTEACGDGIVQTGEQCDDTNSNDTDSCSNNCMMQMAQPDAPPDAAVVDAPPTGGPDAGNPATGDGGGCCQTGDPNAAPWLALLVVWFLLRRR